MDRRTFINANTLGIAGASLASGSAFAANDETGTVRESARDIPVHSNADILVLGGGPSGCAAALAAARLGADVLLVERYGYLGGMATGGLVIGYFEYDKQMRGIVSEINDNIIAYGGRMVETNRVIKHEPFFNPEMFKMMCMDMLQEANVRMLFHAWAVGAKVEDDTVSTVFIESKGGRKAIQAKMIIDCTGDADTAEWTGIPHENTTEPNGLALDFIYENVDFDKYRHFKTYEPERHDKVMAGASKNKHFFRPWYIGWNDVAWFNTTYHGNPTDLDDLSNAEIDLRGRIKKHLAFFRKNVPGFEIATLKSTAHQIGCRVSRRITGEYVVTMDDLKRGTFDDTIGKICPLKEGELLDFPYRSLVPQKINNVLYGGRCVSGTVDVIQRVRGMSGCIVFGQGAGVAGALSLKQGIIPRKLDITLLQKTLRTQGVAI